MQVIHDFLDGACYLDLTLTKAELLAILTGQMITGKKKLLGQNYYIGIRQEEENATD